MTSSSSSCDADAVFALQAGGACAGVGTCVNSTINPARLLCLCNDGYSGASDFFDTRVELLPDGRFLSLTCGESRAGTCVIWGIVVLFGLVRLRQLIPAFLRIYRKHYADLKKAEEGILTDFALRTISYDLFATTPILFTAAISKLCGLTLGTDVLPTVCLAAVVLSFNVTTFDLSRREFAIFVQGTMSASHARRAQKTRTGLKIFSLAVYTCVTVIPTLWSLSLDKSLGPLENFEFLSIVLRNAGLVLWGMLEVITTWMVSRQIQVALASSSAGASDPSERHYSPTHMDLDARTTQVVKKLGAEVHSLLVFLAITGTLYGLFVIPFFYPFQTYCIGFVVASGALRHSGKSFPQDDDPASRIISKRASKEVINAPSGVAAVVAASSAGAGDLSSSQNLN